MMLSLAPMEGVTGYIFRRVHAEHFGALDKYYTPFVAPPRVGSAFGGKAAREVDPKLNEGLNVVPQLLTKDADEFVWAAELFAEMGYTEVNLNLGCPSGTVVNKGRGSGFLRDPDALEAFLSDICARSPLPVSVKTRLGLASDAEYPRILEIYRRLPLAELIVHPRVREDRYGGTPRVGAFAETLADSPFPVAYNGDIFSPTDMARLLDTCPATSHVVLGRGIVANPALARVLAGGPQLTLDELRKFHDALFCAYEEEMGGNAVFRMKEWWFYAQHALSDPLAAHRAVRKLRRVGEYKNAVKGIFATQRLASEPWFRA